MRTTILVLAIFCAAGLVRAQSDPVIASTQQVLKDQGFYYGEVTGKKDAETIAALRRYQIRNGLQVTGELNTETQKSLGVKGTSTPIPTPRPTAPPPKVVSTPPPNNSDRREEVPIQNDSINGEPSTPPMATDIFSGTPYQNAALDMQRRVIMNVQTVLARRGYLHTTIDGEFGPDTEFAVRAYQARFNIRTTGRLDRATLTAMGLMPGQRTPGVTAQPAATRERIYRPVPRTVTPDGEPIYEGR